MNTSVSPNPGTIPWNKGKFVGQKPPLKLKEVWAIRTRLQLAVRHRNLALFNLALDSKLRGCDLVRLRVKDVTKGGRVARRASIVQQKTQMPVQFEITKDTRDSVSVWVSKAQLVSSDYLLPSRQHESGHISTRQYARIANFWFASVGLDPAEYGTHSLRRTKPTLIYRRTKNLRAVQLLLGHTKLESTVRYLGIEVEDALEIAEQTDI
jgi:integrase